MLVASHTRIQRDVPEGHIGFEVQRSLDALEDVVSSQCRRLGYADLADGDTSAREVQ
jgi:hypothetical protein